MKDALRATLQKILKDYIDGRGVSIPPEFQIELEVTKDASHGDFSTPLAFRLAQWVKAKPASIADDLVRLFEKELDQLTAAERPVSRMEVAGGGFINFFVASSQLAKVLVKIHEKDLSYGESNFGEGKKVLIEFVSANPTGPLTIAHGRQAAVGDALARILETVGFKVTKEYYLNDAGLQMDLLGKSVWYRYRGQVGQPIGMPEESYKGEYLIPIARKLKEQEGDSLLGMSEEEAIKKCSQFAADEIMKGIREDLQTINVHFDRYFSETQEIYNSGLIGPTIEELRKNGLIFDEDGALWFRSTELGDDKNRVLRKSSGEYTYLTPDIAYHRNKFERGFGILVNLWGPDHHGYIPRLKAACKALGYSPDNLKILIVQLVTLYRQGKPVRMSTRAGEFVTLRELFKEVGVDATRFFFLLRRVESHLDFDLDLAKEQSDENPVYYLQYAHARISSILGFAQKKVTSGVNLERLNQAEEIELIKKLQEYPEFLIQASQALEPYRVVDSLRDLAASFHKFYALHRVVSEDEELTQARLLLVDAVRIVLRNGLAVLGISHPAKM